MIGKNQKLILDPMKDGAVLYCDGDSMWGVILEEDGAEFIGRVSADAARRLVNRGLVRFSHTKPEYGDYRQDRDVYVLTEKGKAL